jgi:hypothetical protein
MLYGQIPTLFFIEQQRLITVKASAHLTSDGRENPMQAHGTVDYPVGTYLVWSHGCFSLLLTPRQFSLFLPSIIVLAAGCSIQGTTHQYQVSLSQSASPFQTSPF